MGALNQADLVVILVVLYFTCLGWVQGVARFLLALLALFISGQIALTSFQGTYDILESLKIFFLLSIGISFLLWIGLSVWNRMVVKSKKCTTLSRTLGALVGFFWSLSLSISIMFVLVVSAPQAPFLKKVKRFAEGSYSYTAAEANLFSRYPIYQALKKMHEQPELVLETSTQTLQEAQQDGTITSVEAQAIYHDEKLQEILRDVKIQKMIEDKDIARLVANPKVQSLLRDKEFVKKLLEFYRRVAQENL